MTAVTLLFVAEFIVLLAFVFLLLNNKIHKFLLILCIAFICLAQFAATSVFLVDIESIEPDSFVFKLFANSFSVVCICSDLILFLSAWYVLDFLGFKSVPINALLVCFLIFIAADCIAFGTNSFTSFAYRYFSVPILDVSPEHSVFIYRGTTWFIFHQCFTLVVSVLIISAAIFKCALTSVALGGRYIVVASYTAICAMSNIVYNYVPLFYSALNYPVFLLDLLPVVIAWQLIFYKPMFIKNVIRKVAFEDVSYPVAFFDIEDLLLHYNKAAAEIFGFKKKDIFKLTLSDFLFKFLGSKIRNRSASTIEEISVKTKSGTVVNYNMDFSKYTNYAGKNCGTMLIFHDITTLKKFYGEMEKSVTTDAVTGFASRLLLERKITEINLYRKYPYTAVVCSLNGLLLITESFGSDFRNELLVYIAKILREKVSAFDFIACDNSNITILMPNTTKNDAELLFKRIAQTFENDKSFDFTLSIEYAICERADKDTDMHIAVDHAMATMRQNKIINSEAVHKSIIKALLETFRWRNPETESHSRRVQAIAVKIGKKLGFSENELSWLSTLALFHDIGKMSVPYRIINKPESMTDEERDLLRLHVINGYKIAKASPELAPIARCILCHHERWDGKGYPKGYSGEEIPRLSRIVSIADAFDVMISGRPYQEKIDIDSAVAEIKNNSGTQFDPEIAEIFIKIPVEELSEAIS